MSKNRHTRDHIIKSRKKYIRKRMYCMPWTRDRFSYLNDKDLSEWDKKMEENSWHMHWKHTKNSGFAEELRHLPHMMVREWNISDGMTIYSYASDYTRYHKRPFLPGYLSKNRSHVLKNTAGGKASIDGFGPRDARRILTMEEEICEYFEEHYNSNSLFRNIPFDRCFMWHD